MRSFRATIKPSDAIFASEDPMDQMTSLLTALRASSALRARTILEKAEVELIAESAGIDHVQTVTLIDKLQSQGSIKIRWGGALEVLPPPPAPNASAVLNFPNSTFGPGAVIGGLTATGGQTTVTPNEAFGLLAAVISEIKLSQSRMTSDVAQQSAETIEIIKSRPPNGSSAEAHHDWVERTGKFLTNLLKSAPEVKDAVELGQKALESLGWK